MSSNERKLGNYVDFTLPLSGAEAFDWMSGSAEELWSGGLNAGGAIPSNGLYGKRRSLVNGRIFFPLTV